MTDHRVTYQDEAVFITSGDYLSDQTAAGSLRQISRVETLAWSVNYGLLNEVYVDAGNDTINRTRPTVLCNIDYYTTDGLNELFFGLTTGDARGIFNGLNEQKNVYIVSNWQDGRDLVGNSSTNRRIIGLGQALINSYSLSVAAGGVMSSSVTFEALNAQSYSGISGYTPVVDPLTGNPVETSAFVLPTADKLYKTTVDGIARNVLVNRGLETHITFPTGSQFIADLNSPLTFDVQNFRVDFALSRNSLQSMGSAFPANRPIIFPVQVNVNAEVILTDRDLKKLTELGCMTTTGQDIILSVNPDCGGSAPFSMRLMGLQLESQSSNTAVGKYETYTFNWNLTVSNPTSLENNVFLHTLLG